MRDGESGIENTEKAGSPFLQELTGMIPEVLSPEVLRQAKRFMTRNRLRKENSPGDTYPGHQRGESRSVATSHSRSPFLQQGETCEDTADNV